MRRARTTTTTYKIRPGSRDTIDISYVEEAKISTRGHQPLCGGQSSWFRCCKSYASRVEIVSSGRNHPANNGILAASPWGWAVCYWFSCPTGNIHHSPNVLASYCICWKWSCCEKAYTDPLEWLWWTLPHPTIEGRLNYTGDVAVGHGNRYIAIHPYFFKASFLDPHTHHYLKKILTVENFNKVRLIINSALHHHHETRAHIISPTLFSRTSYTCS